MREFPKIKSVPLLVDRIRISSEKKGRICDSLSLCYEMAEGFVNIFEVEKQKWHPFSLHFSCSKDKLEFPEIAPHFFSFNNPYGACPDCHGFGNHLKIDEDLIVPNPTLSLKDGAIDPFTKPSHRILHRKMLDFAQRHKIKTNVPYQNLTNKQKKLLFNGDGIFKGLAGFFERLERKKYKLAVRVFLSRYKNAVLCPTCHGRRLRNETQWVHISKKSIADVLSMTIEDASTFFIGITLAQVQQKLVSDVISQIRNRLDFLLEVGLDYLELSRLSRSLSGGEYQRIQLARQLGSKLTETTYILDEPTIGLHPSDVGNLVTIMKRIRDGGNTLLVVEHEKIVMEAADNILELGPGSGHLGGEIVYSGPLQNMHNTLTASYLRNPNKIPIPKKRRTAHQFLKLNGVSHHNLHNFDVEIPLQSLVCISGVSGSGKTSLIQDTLYRTLAKIFHFTPGNIGKFKTISGHTHLDDVSLLDQRPLSQSQRSNPMTYLKAYDEIRVLFSQTLDARRLSLSPKHFSFNVSGGRCENCHGRGLQVIDMQFLEDMELVCESCHGKKFKSEILDVQYKGKNIDDVLEMTVSEALYFFSHSLPLLRKLSILRDVGLDYLKLGQHISTLSGGEAQRLKIAAELSAKKKNSILYILDEPTTGLHFHDITKLLYVLNRLIDQGHSVLVIEHNLDVLKCADYIIDLGPGGGKHGGRLVACGTPEQIALCEDSLTGKYLKSVITDT
ncbi:MAG: excinuclease ABC subunit UvrA [Deltaproteobacteria bacterium]|nr:excinuclease ABC subunit UvrA [Deltaproteobacteria bacterium]